MSHAVRGWCPGAWRPMMSGDGLVVRVRPRLARLSAAQVLGLCEGAQAHGAGLIDLTNRANLQIRGVAEDAWPTLMQALAGLGLLDEDPALEPRRNILVAPGWVEGDDTHRLAQELMARLAELPDLPAKTGFAIDAGPGPVLAGDPADFRIERGTGRGLILRADGRALGLPLAPGGEIDALIALARWFAETGTAAGRMARHAAPLPGWAEGVEAPAAPRPVLRPGGHAAGLVAGLAFGQVEAAALAGAMRATGAPALRLTPWRAVLFEGAAPRPLPGFVAEAGSPLMAADACPGAPLCPQASVATRDLARALAPRVAGGLHVSACAKGCARPRPAGVVLTGRAGRFDLAFDACAGDTPVRTGLTEAQVLDHFGARDALSV